MASAQMKRKPSRSRRSRRRRPPLGQHFLADARLRDQIVGLLDPSPADTWVEIGAGHGEMTLELAKASGRITAIETDAELAKDLQARLAAFPHAQVVQDDILQVDLGSLVAGQGKVRVYGNLPYYITSPILQRLLQAIGGIRDIHVVVQQEVAERLASPPGGRAYGYLSVLAQFHCAAEVLLPIPPGAFHPPPRVHSALVELVPAPQQRKLGVAEPDSFLRFLALCFRHKRKTLLNNLRSVYPTSTVEAALEEAGCDRRVRAEQLSLEAFARVYHSLPAR